MLTSTYVFQHSLLLVFFFTLKRVLNYRGVHMPSDSKKKWRILLGFQEKKWQIPRDSEEKKWQTPKKLAPGFHRDSVKKLYKKVGSANYTDSRTPKVRLHWTPTQNHKFFK